MFVDRVRILAKAGNGDSGCCSFRREKFVARGGPNGGNGGRGGDVILQADGHVNSLVALFYEPLVRSRNGENGRGKKQHGHGADARIVRVPVGTVVYQLSPKFQLLSGKGSISEPNSVADLSEHGQGFVLCKGGRGGKGNA